MMTLVLSLFPGIGLLDRAFEEHGFCVVRGPDLLWGGDVNAFHPPAAKFDGVIGGPPCKAFSRLAHMVKYNHEKSPDKYHLAENLIPEFERCVRESAPCWFLMENVPDAPVPCVDGYGVVSFLLNNRWLPDTTPQNRLRRFSFGVRGGEVDLRKYLELSALEPIDFAYAVLANGSNKVIPVRMNKGGVEKKVWTLNRGGKTKVTEMAQMQGLPADFLADAPFTVTGKREVIGNGVPLPMGRALAKAIREWVEGVE